MRREGGEAGVNRVWEEKETKIDRCLPPKVWVVTEERATETTGSKLRVLGGPT